MAPLSETFFFICYPQGDQSRLTVIDLAWCVDYERNEWAAATPHDYMDRDEAIRSARALAVSSGKSYELFDSRYDESTSEYLGEFE